MSNLLSEVHPELISEWSDKNLPLTPDKITFGSNKKVWWKGACGHEWQTSVKARSNGEKCPICSGARVVKGINDLATLKPELAVEWSKKNTLKPTEVSIGSHKKIVWKGKCGHEWIASVKSRAISNTSCPYCSHNKILAGYNDLASQMPQVAAEWSENNYPLMPNQVTVFANRKVWWRCSKCGYEWNTLISTRSGGSGCPCCSGLVLVKGVNDFATTHSQLAAEWSERNFPLAADMVNAKSRKNVWWKCSKCGYEWKSVVCARIKGTVCPVCADRAVLTGYNDLAITDAYLLSEWDYERKTLRCQCSECVNLSRSKRHNGIQTIHLLKVQYGKLTQMLSCSGKQCFCIIIELFFTFRSMNHSEYSEHHSLVTSGKVIKELLHLFFLLFHIIRNGSGKVIVRVLSSLPVRNIRFYSKQSALSFFDCFICRNRHNINGHHQITVHIGKLSNHTVFNI